MAAHLTPEEQARNDATPAWLALPAVQQRMADLRAIAAADGHRFDADGITAMLQAFIALDKANPMPSVIEAMEQGLV